jgi:SAM-dependent methyltransferase
MSHIHVNIEESDKGLFDKIAEKYARKDIIESSSGPRRYQLAFAVGPIFKKIPHINTIVEIACGFGASSKYLSGNYEKYIGIDYSEKLIEKAREFYRDNSKAEFIAANIKDIITSQIYPRSADIILAVGALHHMTDLDEVMKSLANMTNPGAYFIAIEPNRANPIIQAMRWIWARINPSYSKDQVFFSKRELRDLLVRHNFQNIELEYQGFFSPPFAQVIISPQFISVPLSKIAIFLDKIFDRFLPGFLKFLSWTIVVRAEFPGL